MKSTSETITIPRINTLPGALQPIVTDASVLYDPDAQLNCQQIVNDLDLVHVQSMVFLNPNTRKQIIAAHKKMGKFLINAYVEERIEFCERIVHNNPSQSAFSKDGPIVLTRVR